MFEFEDISTGFHDVFFNRYTDTSAPIMDLYISDSMQDMLDIDIKSEVATVVGGVNEFSSLLNFDLPSLELDSNSTDGENLWLAAGSGPKWAANDIYADVGACVNPNTVMPVLLKSPKQSNVNLNTNINSSDITLPSPKERKSHLTFSPNMIKVPVVSQQQRPVSSLAHIQNVKKDLSDHLINGSDDNKIVIKREIIDDESSSSLSPKPSSIVTGIGAGKGSTIKIGAGLGGLTFANMNFNSKFKSNQNGAIKQLQNSSMKRDSSPYRQTSYNNINNNYSSGSPKPYKAINGSNTKVVNNNSVNKSKPKPTGQEFPKPAYSYSCLIAMALKNSRSGSLPVSEIYSFMCEHFPYFKTAPNGWKNSVRHNLSLNKCFEKIEKPATNGGQRKGCLWAMNPAKISKMDEEVQKWSRKDPMAIKRAMVYPEHLEALERGEMKHGSSGDSSDGENDGSSDIDEQSDFEQEDTQETEGDSFIMNTPESLDDRDDVEVDFDMEQMIECHDDLYVDNKSSYTIDFDDDADSMYLSTTVTKRARLDINYQIQPQQFNVQQNHNRRKTPLVNRIA